ncbi:iron ABC transporter permease [Allofranklinella schreckenbergeri]|uniref:Iron ABC transporter permease n=1 Tax=Allofranklinella schreckenbergeri TaxID=1076744 RepID=A0A3M6Q344_9BURK|nr:iron ABC transporter permease [Allofranklinella schreckenbergeri]RMW96823.1 iron ABC transporter permease [Allofranklinella schreckenbergeri]RMW96970.1 iron ABC transporter permease [Allofranklinella schreckenbergeri]
MNTALRSMAAVAALALLALLSLAVGYIDTPLPRLLQGAWQGEIIPTRILLDLRLPRTLLCLAVGAALGMAGAALQGLLRNPLAEPGLLGVSSGAALGAVIALYSGFSSVFVLALPLAGMAGTAVAVGFVFLLAGRQASTTLLILAGVAVSAMASALISLVMNWTRNVYALQEIVFWLMGSLADRSQREVALALPFIALGMALLLSTRRGLLALALGEETAHSMGVNISRLRTLVLLGTAASVGAAVSVSGSIGFIGLVAPHLMRPFVRGNPAQLLPLAAWAGAALLLLADMGVRWLYVGGQELRLGVLTALIGSPFFLLLILRLHWEGRA